MQTKELVYKLQLISSTIEELELGDIVNVFIDYTGQIDCQVNQLTVTGDDVVWVQRFSDLYPWKKEYYYNNIYFHALCTQEEYDKERSSWF